MRRYNVHEAKSNLSKLLAIVEKEGEEIVIMRDGKPVAKLVRYREPGGRRRLGFAAGAIRAVEGWERALTDEEADAFLEGRG